MYIRSAVLSTKSTADMTARSISAFGRPAASSAKASASYIHGWPWRCRKAAPIRAITWSNFCSFISRRTASRTAVGCGSFFEKYRSQTTSGLAPSSISISIFAGRLSIVAGA